MTCDPVLGGFAAVLSWGGPGLTAHWLSVASTRAATVGATSRQLVMTARNSVRASSTLQLGAALGVSSHFTAAAAEVERRR